MGQHNGLLKIPYVVQIPSSTHSIDNMPIIQAPAGADNTLESCMHSIGIEVLAVISLKSKVKALPGQTGSAAALPSIAW